jgi:hypothetical protein
MNNKILETTITIVLYVALAAGLLLVGQKIVVPIVTKTLSETLIKAAQPPRKVSL